MVIRNVDHGKSNNEYFLPDSNQPEKKSSKPNSIFKRIVHFFSREQKSQIEGKQVEIKQAPQRIDKDKEPLKKRLGEFVRGLLGIRPSNYQAHKKAMHSLRADLEENGWVSKGIGGKYQIDQAILLLDKFIIDSQGDASMNEKRKTARDDLQYLRQLVQTKDKIMTRKTRVANLSLQLNNDIGNIKNVYQTQKKITQEELFEKKQELQKIENEMEIVWNQISKENQSQGLLPAEYKELQQKRTVLNREIDEKSAKADLELMDQMRISSYLAAIFEPIKSFDDQGFMDFVCRVDAIAIALFEQPNVEQTQFCVLCALEAIKNADSETYHKLSEEGKKTFSLDATEDPLQAYKAWCSNVFADDIPKSRQ